MQFLVVLLFCLSCVKCLSDYSDIVWVLIPNFIVVDLLVDLFFVVFLFVFILFPSALGCKLHICFEL